MVEDSERLLSTIEQVLRTGRVGPSNRQRNFAFIDLHELIEECVSLARKLHKLEPESITYSSRLPLRIRGDDEEVRAAVLNLIDNAVQYSGNHVRVRVETAKLDDAFLAVRVKDEGLGIPKAELKRIFKRFYRIPGAAFMRQKGTGLGLYIVRSVAKRHGGRAWAESEGPGHGSTFVVQFPIAK